MDAPLNIKQRNKAILRFTFMCLICTILLVYHTLITMHLFR